MRESWIIVGAGSAGCVLANRLSADPERHVTVLDTGPDLVPGHVPDAISGPSFFAALAEPGRMFPDLLATRATGIPPTVYQRGRGVGGSSAVNAMVALRGSDDVYAGWGWHDRGEAWSRVQIPGEPASLDELGPVDRALLQDHRCERLKLTRSNGQRVTAAQAYLWPALARTNLSVRADAEVERVLHTNRGATGVRLVDGTEIPADQVVVAAGAIHSPVVLLRSGIDTPGVGQGLQDHPSAVFAMALKQGVAHDGTALPIGSAVHATIDDHRVQVLPMSNLGPDPDVANLGALMAALMNPVGRAGTVTIDDHGHPVIDFALLDDPRDVRGLSCAVGLALEILDSAHFADIVDAVYIDDVGTTTDALSDDAAIETWLRGNCADYVHATSTCAMGTVVDERHAVIDYENLFVCDASVFPSIPDANTHLPTTMVAERFCLQHA